MSTPKPTITVPISDHPLWEKAKKQRTLLSVAMEITARCNNDCVHCYINLPENDTAAIKAELTTEEIKSVVDEAVSLGSLWFLLTGGEPLLRNDFCEIYEYIKRKGALVSVFTNATLITDAHIRLFKKYPPRDIEVSVYGVTNEIYEKVTRKKTFSTALRGVESLMRASLPVTLKTTLMRSNYTQFDRITEFCREGSVTAFRFDPFLHLRLDGNAAKNKRIKSERLSADEIIHLEENDIVRHDALKKQCVGLNKEIGPIRNPGKVFRCQAGTNDCCIGYDGMIKLCSALTDKSCTYDLKKGSLSDAWRNFFPTVISRQSQRGSFKDQCGSCRIIDFCMWCPANAYLETGWLDGFVPYFCEIAKKRRAHFDEIG